MIKLIFMETITMLDVRQRSREIVDRLNRGEAFRLTYRNRLVAELRPVVSQPEESADDAIYGLSDHAEELGGELTASEADRLLYDR